MHGFLKEARVVEMEDVMLTEVTIDKGEWVCLLGVDAHGSTKDFGGS